MASVRFETRLIPHRSTWASVRLTWMPLGLGLLCLVLANLLESVVPAAAQVVGMLSGLAFIAGVLYLHATWRRGPALIVDDGVLRVGRRQAPLAGLAPQVGEFVFRSQSRFSAGTFWMPMLTLRLADGHALRIGCEGGGGPADGRAPTVAPDYLLPEPQWHTLVALTAPRPG